jgi:hypothetical protein
MATRKSNGYGGLIWDSPTGKKHLTAHRVAWEVTNGPIPQGLCVCHRCDVPWCVNPDHLFLGTKGDNNKDKAKKGRSPRGSHHPLVHVSEEEVHVIRWLASTGMKTSLIASQFGISWENAYSIACRKTWKHLNTPYDIAAMP